LIWQCLPIKINVAGTEKKQNFKKFCK